MSPSFEDQPADRRTAADLTAVEEHIRRRLAGQVRDFLLLVTAEGLILRGRARTYYAKQLAQQAVAETARAVIKANEIEVS